MRGKAETCAFVTKSVCGCGTTNNVDYTENIMRDVLVTGIYDMEIRCDILGVEGVIDRLTNQVIALVEKKEMARDANVVSVSTSAISSRWEVHMPHNKKKHCSPSRPKGPLLCQQE